MLKILPKITFGQTQNPQKPRTAATAPKFERAPKCDCVNFGTASVLERHINLARNLTLKDNLMQHLLPGQDYCGLPINFLFAMKNAPSHHLVENIPDIIQGCGLPPKEALTKLDKIASILRIASNIVDFSSFKIGNKVIGSKEIGFGISGKVFKLKSDDCAVAFKVFKHPKRVGVHDIFGETAMAREMLNANVYDTAQLYMASPNQYTGWMMTGFIDKTTQIPKRGITLEEFFRIHGLRLNESENGEENFVTSQNKVKALIDFGGIETDSEFPIINLDIRDALLEDTNPQKSCRDEGTRMGFLTEFITNQPLIRLGSKPKYPLEIESAFDTPEGRLIYSFMTERLKKDRFSALLKDIDVVGDFKVGA